MILNPISGRKVKKKGSVGKKLIEDYKSHKKAGDLKIVKKIKGFEIEKNVGVLSGAPICSKTQKFLNENNITVKSL